MIDAFVIVVTVVVEISPNGRSLDITHTSVATYKSFTYPSMSSILRNMFNAVLKFILCDCRRTFKRIPNAD